MQKLIFIIPFFLIGCANLKKTNTETEIKTDSVSVNTLNTWIDSDKYTLQPADLTQPMKFVNSKGEVKEYFNTIIKHEKEIIHEQKKDSTAKTIDLKQDKTEKEKDYTLLIESLATKIFWLLIILFVIKNVLEFIKNKKTAM